MNCNDHKYRVYGYTRRDGDRDYIGCEGNPPPPDAKSMVEDGGANAVYKITDGVMAIYTKADGGTNFAFSEEELKGSFNFGEGRAQAYSMINDELYAVTVSTVDLSNGIYVVVED